MAAAKEKILIVDDSEMNRSILADMLADEFDVAEAANGAEAVRNLTQHAGEYAIMLLDIVMPEMDGFGVLEAMNEYGWIEFLPVIMISAETNPVQIERAYNLGATDFIMRPFDASIVHRRVINTVLLYRKQKKLIGIIEEQVNEKKKDNNLMVDILSHIVEFRNGESGLHIRNVRRITEFLLRTLSREHEKYRLSESEISIITMASALHDIGKIGIDEKILNKPGRLTEEEYAVMKRHSALGAQMLENIVGYGDNPLVRTARDICRWHHERYDGRGYPDGLSGDAIPISAQVVALADVYDALTSERVYKKPIPHAEAVKMIAEGKCGVFNPVLLQCFTEVADRIRSVLAREDGDEGRTRVGIRSFSEAVLHSGERQTDVSARTLKLLDYERKKYDFFAAMTQEIQFEYVAETDTLTISPFGAKRLGLPESFRLADKRRQIGLLFGDDWFEKLAAAFAATTPEKPELRNSRRVKIEGENRWFDAIVRAVWSDTEPPRIEGALGKLIDVTESRTRMGELMEKASRDPLTGLWNRSASREQIETRIRSYPAHKYAVAIFDVDFFKNANDTYGHQFGDRVLKEVAGRLLHSTRAYDICARIGGDEFLIFLEYDTEIDPIIRRIFRTLCGRIDEYDFHVSMGAVEMSDENETYDTLFRKADLALYYSKRQGRAQVNLYNPSMEDVLFDSDISEIIGAGEEPHEKEKP